jgi:hypothetical protein
MKALNNFGIDVGLAKPWRRYISCIIAREISSLSRYYDRVLQWLPRQDDTGLVLHYLEAKEKRLIGEDEVFPDLTGEKSQRTAIFLNGTFNHHFDIQGLLGELKPKLSRTSRLLVVAFNPYLSWLYYLANLMKIRKGEVPTTFLTRKDMANLASLSGYAIVRQRNMAYCPWRLGGVGDFINRVLPSIPGLRWLGFAYLLVMRPIILEKPPLPSISCIIPARNERGNIENILDRFPDMGVATELIFVEGHSQDGTWEEIQRLAQAYKGKFSLKTIQQRGQGKGDAVRLGFSQASGDLLIILDADLSLPPEMLKRFYEAYCQGQGDFINGSRLVYPMEGQAMRFLNRLGNIFFAKSLSWVLDVSLTDSLCGTKLVARHDYDRMVAWRQDFGDFDPFGDYEIIFPAAVLGLGLVDIPVRYLARTYGSTNIRRFRHGWMLLAMTLRGFSQVKIGAHRCNT